MNRTRKKWLERALARDFLARQGIPFRVAGIRSVRERLQDGKHISGPDVKVTCLQGSSWCRVGVELVEYQADVHPKLGSPGRRKEDFWKSAVKELVSGHFRKHPDLKKYRVSVMLNDNALPKKDDVHSLTTDLVGFVQSVSGQITNQYTRFFCRKYYPVTTLLGRHVFSISTRLGNESIYEDPHSIWSYNSSACVGIRSDVVSNILTSKAQKQLLYDWTGCSQKWLLICATGQTCADGAGDKDMADMYLLKEPFLGLARNSGFDRVFFWERVHRWVAALK